MKNLILALFLFFLSACSLEKLPDKADATAAADLENQKGFIATIVAQTLTAMQPTVVLNEISPTPAFTITPSATPENEWVEHTISLYGTKISLPRDWQLQEVNRRPEPTDPNMYEIVGHDCADYEVNSPDGLTILKITSACGFNEGYWDPLPEGSIIINPDAESKIARYPMEGSKYAYFHVCYDPSFRNGEAGICSALFGLGDGVMGITLEYSGPKDKIDGAFEITDQIVLKIAK
jgi:hypothetical protein